LQDEIILGVDAGQCCPVDGIDVAQLGILLNAHSAADDTSQRHEAKILHVRHLIYNLKHDVLRNCFCYLFNTNIVQEYTNKKKTKQYTNVQ